MPRQRFTPATAILAALAVAVLSAFVAPVPAAAGENGADPRPYAESAHAANIDAALAFMLKDRSLGRWMNLAVLDFLQRKFGLHERYRLVNTFGAVDPSKGDISAVAPLGRLVDPAHEFEPAPLQENAGFLDFMYGAAYCDRFPVAGDFLDRLHGQLKEHQGKGGLFDYSVTHLALAFQWMLENGCVGADAGGGVLHGELGEALVEIAMRNGRDKDISFEAVAFLYYMGFGDRVPRAWLDQITDVQQPDGGWKYDAKNKFSDGHPTVLALWALLEAAVPNAPDVPWIMPAKPRETE